MENVNKAQVLKDALHDHLMQLLTDGEQVLVTDRETGETRETRVQPSAATLGVIRAFLKDFPPESEGARLSPSTVGVLKQYAKALPFGVGTVQN